MNFNKKSLRAGFFICCLILLFSIQAFSLHGKNFDQSQNEDEVQILKKAFENLQHRLDSLAKAIDDVLWYHSVGDICYVDKVRITGLPNPHEKNPTAMGAKNPIKFYCYVFIPRDIVSGNRKGTKDGRGGSVRQ